MPAPKKPKDTRDVALILNSMGATLEEAIDRDRILSKRRVRESRVCICGHGATSHTETLPGIFSCQPSRMTCHCQTLYSVITVPDTRVFRRMSNGYGVDHALVRGIAALASKGMTDIEFITETYKCKSSTCRSTTNLVPVLIVAATGQIVQNNKQKARLRGEIEPHTDIWLCRKCLKERLEGEK